MWPDNICFPTFQQAYNMRAQLSTPQQVMFECCEQRSALHSEGLKICHFTRLQQFQNTLDTNALKHQLYRYAAFCYSNTTLLHSKLTWYYIVVHSCIISNQHYTQPQQKLLAHTCPVHIFQADMSI